MREITHTKARFISLALITALGAMTLVGIQASAINMRNIADATYRQRQLFDLHLRADTGFTAEDITAITNTAGVAKVMASHTFDAYLLAGGEMHVLRTFSLPTTLNQVTLAEGRLPENPEEIAVERRVLTDNGYDLGHRIALKLEDMDTFDNIFTSREFTIVGVVESPLFLTLERGRTSLGGGTIRYYAYLHPSAYAPNVFTDVYIAMEASREMFSLSQAYDDMAQEWAAALTATGDARTLAVAAEIESAPQRIKDIHGEIAMVQQVLTELGAAIARAGDTAPAFNLEMLANWAAHMERLEEALIHATILSMTPIPQWHYFTRTDGIAFNDYFQDTLRLQQLGYVFPIVFFFVAVLVTLTSMSRMVEEQRVQMGTYKALGYHSAAILLKYGLYATLSGLFGGFLGILIGSQIFPRVIVSAYSGLYNMPRISTPIPLGISVFAVLASVLSVLCVTVVTATRTTAGAPAQLLRPKAPKPGKRVLLERIPFVWRRMGFIEKVTARNIFRYKRRFFMTLAGVAGCTALLVTAFGMRNSLNRVAGLQFGEIIRYNAVAYIHELRDDQQRQRLDAFDFADMKLYSRQEATTVRSNKPGGGQITASIVVPKDVDALPQFIRLNSMDGTPLTLPESGAVLSEKLAEDLGLAIGDTAQLRMTGGETYTVTVGGIVENYVMHFVYMSPAYYAAIFNATPYPNTILLSGNVHFQQLNGAEDVRAVVDMADRKRTVSNSTDALGIVTVLILLASCALSFIVLFNLTVINLAERRRELATIKVLGFEDREASMYLGRENLAVTALGILIGLAIGYYLSGFVISSIEVNIIRFPRDIAVSSFVYAAALSFVFALLVNFVTHWKITGIDMVESLKSVE